MFRGDSWSDQPLLRLGSANEVPEFPACLGNDAALGEADSGGLFTTFSLVYNVDVPSRETPAENSTRGRFSHCAFSRILLTGLILDDALRRQKLCTHRFPSKGTLGLYNSPSSAWRCFNLKLVSHFHRP